VEGYVQFRGASDFNLQVVAVDFDGGHELVEQGAVFVVGGCIPDGGPVDLGE